MGRSPSDTRKSLTRRARPIIEGLEGRRLMAADVPFALSGGANVDPMSTAAPLGPPAPPADATPVLYSTTSADRPAYDPKIAEAAAPLPSRATPAVSAQASNGSFAKNFQQFTYRTPRGAKVTLSIQGRGSLEGTYVDAAGALNLRYDRSNSYTKIVSRVEGGSGRADLASVYSADQASSGTVNSLSGIGSPVIGMINLRQFDLIPGGTINVTAGIGVLGLRSAATGSQIQLRELEGMIDASQRSDTTGNTATYNNSLANIIDTSSSSSSSSSNTANPIISDVFLVQTLAGGDGEFLTAGNALLQTDSKDPGPPPPPPGVVITIDQVNGRLAAPPDLQTDSRMFGYDPATGRVLRFQLNLENGTGAVDGTFAPIAVAGSPADVGLALGRDGQRQVLLVNDGSAVSAYDATYGTSLGSFTVPAGYYATGSTDSFTVIGNPAANMLMQVDVTASLDAGTAVAPAGNPAPYTPPAGLSLLGGITGLPGSNNVYTSVAAPFNTLQPLENQLGYLNVSVTTTTADPQGGATLVNRFGTTQQKAYMPGGAYVPVPSGNPNDIATAVGSVDRSIAVNTGLATGASAPNTLRLFSQVTQTARGNVVLAYPNQLSDLSESFRPDLAGSVLIDVQGTIQSLKGTTADGMVVNNAGLLNLVGFRSVRNSTILAEPTGHVQIQRRDNVSIVSTARSVAGRGGVTYAPTLQQIGPLSQTRDRPQA